MGQNLRLLQSRIDGTEIVVKVENLQEVISDLINQDIIAALEDAAIASLQEAAQQAPFDTGAFAASLNDAGIEVIQLSPSEFSIVASNVVDYGEFIEEGRAPGRFPPPDKILAWVQRNLLLAGAEARSAAFLIGRKIARQGIPATHVIRNAFDTVGQAAIDDI